MESLSSTQRPGDDRSRQGDDEAPLLGGAFGVYDEGDGLFSLYATPIDAACVARALGNLNLGGGYLEVTPERGLGPGRPITGERLSVLADPLEVLHAPSGDVGPPDAITLMAAPHVALPRGGGRAMGFSLHDRDHGVLYTRLPEVLGAVLTTWLHEIIDTLAAPGSGPLIPDNTLESVLQPIPPQAWRRVLLDRRSRFWSLDVSALVSDDDGRSEILDDLCWVGGPDRAWRAGWSW